MKYSAPEFKAFLRLKMSQRDWCTLNIDENLFTAHSSVFLKRSVKVYEIRNWNEMFTRSVKRMAHHWVKMRCIHKNFYFKKSCICVSVIGAAQKQKCWEKYLFCMLLKHISLKKYSSRSVTNRFIYKTARVTLLRGMTQKCFRESLLPKIVFNERKESLMITCAGLRSKKPIKLNSRNASLCLYY